MIDRARQAWRRWRVERKLRSGEPLLRRDAVPMIRAAKEVGLEALLITNGALLIPDICEELVDLGLDTINVSLNAASDKTHELIHGAPRRDRARIVEMLRHLGRARARREDRKPFVSVSIVVEKENYRGILPLAEQAVQLDADHVYFPPLGMNPASAGLVMAREEEEEARGLVRAPGKLTNAAAFLDRRADAHWTRDLFPHLPCHIGQLYSRVRATGDVYPCAASLRRSLGNLATAPFREVWHSEAYRQFRRVALRPRRSVRDRGSPWSRHQPGLDSVPENGGARLLVSASRLMQEPS